MADSVKIRIGVRNIKFADFAAMLRALPKKLQGRATKAAGEYILREIRKYPPYKHVRRKTAYGGDGFQSDKQRRFVMASLRAGYNLKTGAPMEPGFPHRTGLLQRSWYLEGKDETLTTIKNRAPYAGYAYGEEDQARQLGLVGWQTIGDFLEDSSAEIVNAALKGIDAGIDSFIKSS